MWAFLWSKKTTSRGGYKSLAAEKTKLTLRQLGYAINNQTTGQVN